MVVEGGEDSVDKEKKKNRRRSNRRSKRNPPNPGHVTPLEFYLRPRRPPHFFTKPINFREFKSPSGAIIKVKDKVTNVSDASRTIIYEIENGGILGDITKVKLEVTEDSLAVLAKWTVYYKDTDPQEYLALLKSVSQAVDNHIK